MLRFFKCILKIFVQNGKKSVYFLDEDAYTDYTEVSSEMQTICFPMLPPVIMDWNAARKKKKRPRLYENINITIIHVYQYMKTHTVNLNNFCNDFNIKNRRKLS